MIRSLRLRLLIGTSLAMAVVLALLGIAVYYFTWRALIAQFDAGLMVKAKALASMVEQDDDKVKFDYEPGDMPEFQMGQHKEFFEIWMDDGRVIAKSASLGKANLARGHADAGGAPMTLPDGRHGRSLTISLLTKVQRDEESSGANPPKARAGSLTVAVPTHPMSETLDLLAMILWLACGAAVVVSDVTLLWVVRRGLRPVGVLAREIETIGVHDLSRRVSPARAAVELTPIVEKLNRLLDRVSSAFVREKAFTADVAHELRTPLAGLQTTLEVCRSRPRGAREYEAVLLKCSGIVTRMEAMVTSLLMLTRAEAGQLPVDRKSFDVCAIIEECWAMLADRAAQRKLSVDRDVPEPCIVRGDPDKTRIVLQNLFDNAVSYANEGGTIRIEVEGDGAGTRLRISNTGSQVAAEQVPHLFERFWRGDAARTESGLHCGLGLSLCQRLIDLVGGKIAVESHAGGEFVVTVTLPV
jgi:two-component system sensor histidine kinase QseC